MEDDNGLELSLGLSCGGSSVKPNNASLSDTRAEEVVRSSKMVDDFKSMFDAGPQKPNSVNAQKTDSSKPDENFFSDLSKAKEENASLNLNGRGFWVADSNKPVQIAENKQVETGIKRKMSFSDINNQKKHESNVHHTDLHDKARSSHISMTKDGSAAENEDVADSEAENSMPIPCQGDGTKQFITVGVSSDAPKDVRNMMKVPYPSPAKESNSVHAPNPQISGAMHAMSTTTSELSGARPMFGYSSVQLPMLDKDNTLGLVSRPQLLHPSFAGRGPPNTAAIPVMSHNIFEAMPCEVRPLERSEGDVKHSKQLVTEEGVSSHPEDVIGSITNLRAKNATGEGSSIDFSVIKPGLAADVKFGGGGSCPNLPWVSTTGSGPNGRTISGVTYRYSTNKIKIVCACHGSHMTPEEFVRHANGEANLEGSAVLGTVANGSPAASAHS